MPTNSCTRNKTCALETCSKPDGTSPNEQFFFQYSGGQSVTVTDPAGRDTILSISTNCNGGANPNPSVCKITNPDGTFVSYKYDGKNNLVQKDDPRTDVADITTYDYSLPIPGGGVCQAIGAVQKITFPDNNPPTYPSSREFVRGITTADATTPYQDLINYWTDCRNTGAPGSQTPLAPLVELENLANVVYENKGFGGYEMFRTYKTNALGSVTGFSDAMGKTTRIIRNRDNLPETIVDPGMAITYLTYDTVGNVLTKLAPDRGKSIFRYDTRFNLPTESTDGRGYTTTYTYDRRGNPTLVTTPDGKQAKSEYFTVGEAGAPPLNGLPKNVTAGSNSPQGLTTTTQYDPVTGNTTIVDPPGNLAITTNTYGPATRLIGLPTSTSIWGTTQDGGARVSDFQYNTANNLLLGTLSPPVGTDGRLLTCFGYDETGKRTWVLDPRFTGAGPCPSAASGLANPNATVSAYDNMNRVTLVTKPAEDTRGGYRETKDIHYNPLGQPDRSSFYISDPANPDSVNRGQVDFVYDPVGQLTRESAVDNIGSHTVNYTYDPDGRGRITHVRNDSSELAFDYNQAGDITSVETFSLAGQPASEAQPHARFDFTYDKNGNREMLLENFGAGSTLDTENTVYRYDPAGRVASITGVGRLETTFDYDGLGRRESLNRAFGARTGYSYNTEGLLDGVFNYTGARDEINHFTYAYDPAGRRISMSTRDYDVDYTFNSLDWLQKSDYKNFGKPNSVLTAAELTDEDFTYDKNGNRLIGPAPEQAYTSNTLNRLQTDGSWDYRYDHNGNMVVKTAKTTPADQYYYYYNYKNQLMKIHLYSAASLDREYAYKYDPLGRRIFKGAHSGVNNGTSNWPNARKYLYDGDDIVLEFYRDSFNRDKLLSRFTHGPGVDEPLVWWTDPDPLDATGTMQPYFYNYDGLGSITAITDRSGSVVAKYVYDAFGKTVQNCGPLADRNFYRYTSREYDPETDLYYYRARYYDYRIGKFLQEDPKWDLNLYGYVGNNPIALVDPFGMDMKLPTLEELKVILKNGYNKGKQALKKKTEGAKKTADNAKNATANAKETYNDMKEILRLSDEINKIDCSDYAACKGEVAEKTERMYRIAEKHGSGFKWVLNKVLTNHPVLKKLGGMADDLYDMGQKNKGLNAENDKDTDGVINNGEGCPHVSCAIFPRLARIFHQLFLVGARHAVPAQSR